MEWGQCSRTLKSMIHTKRLVKFSTNNVSLEGLYKAASNDKQKRKQRWLFPFYIAGDDIFFAVAVEDLISGINICKN